tara:strand:+ start:1498 stop:2595 length:1098 start_codon:yes stop_codon:yes gene_type:complete
MQSSEYSWQSAKNAAGYKSQPMKNYSVWVSLAVLLSVLVHLGLFLMFERVQVMMKTAAEAIQINTSPRDRTVVDEADLERIFAEEAPIEETAPTKDTDLTWDEEPPEMPESFPEIVKLTPETDTIKNLFTSESPIVPQSVNVQALDAKIDTQASEAELGAMRQKLAEASRVSINQKSLIIEERDFGNDGANSDELIDAMTKGMSSQARANIKGRFSTLEELMGKGENLPERTEAMIPTDLLFEFGQWELKEEAKLSLMRLGIIITNNKESQFIIKGFTDSIPFKPKVGVEDGPINNIQLSQLRAEAVRDYLVKSLWLNQYDIRAIGYGARNPLVMPTGDYARDRVLEAANRRVEIEIRSGSQKIP